MPFLAGRSAWPAALSRARSVPFKGHDSIDELLISFAVSAITEQTFTVDSATTSLPDIDSLNHRRRCHAQSSSQLSLCRAGPIKPRTP
jgi:hypothetical protein